MLMMTSDKYSYQVLYSKTNSLSQNNNYNLTKWSPLGNMFTNYTPPINTTFYVSVPTRI